MPHDSTFHVLAPFTAYIKVVPARGLSSDLGVAHKAGRHVYWRDLQRLATLVYEELAENVAASVEDEIVLPGGGSGYRITENFGNAPKAVSYTPQMGQKPALLMFEGFYNSHDHTMAAPVSERTTIFSGGRVWSGYGGQKPWLASAGLPTISVQDEVIALHTLIEGAINTISDSSGFDLKVFRLLYKNITWGDGGHFFPTL